MDWNPDRYLAFQTQRFQPFQDLLACIPDITPRDVVDLGCGTGELTSRLAAHFPGSRVLGVDSSGSMLERAQKHRGPSFRRGTIEAFADGAFPSAGEDGLWDLIFSHAALHWAADHPALMRSLWARLRPGGALAVQMPANHDHPVQRAVAGLAAEEPFRSALGGFVRTSPVLGAREYAQLLFELGAGAITAMEKVYPHVLKDADAVVDWTRSTFLLPYLERLDAPAGEAFLENYRSRVRELLPGEPVFYGFRRVLIACLKERESTP